MDVVDLIESTNTKKRRLDSISGGLDLITELRPWQEELLELYKTPTDNRTINWICDAKGSCGKSCFLKYMVHHHNVLFTRGGKYSDVCNMIFKANMKTCRAVFLDIPRAKGPEVSYAALEAIKDGMISNTKYQTPSKLFNAPHVFVFSNFPPDRSKFSADRWNIITIG